MRLALLLAILALPILEIALLIKAGHVLGFWGVLGIIVATAVLGVIAIRRNGFTMARRMADAIESGKSPGATVLDGALTVLAGAMLFAPGLITDTLGLLLLIPPLRSAISNWASGHLFGPIETAEFDVRTGQPEDGVVIEGEFERLDEHTMPPRSRPGRNVSN